jgi:hypothetical protein
MAKYTGVTVSTGAVLIEPATTGGHPTLWNPAGSNVTVAIRRLELSYVTGDNAPIAIEWAWVDFAGAAYATGSPVATATIVAPIGRLGTPASNKAKWSPTTNTFTAVPSYLRASGVALFTGIATTARAPFVLRADYDADDFVIGQGVAVCLCTAHNAGSNATTTAAFQIAVTWEELPA